MAYNGLYAKYSPVITSYINNPVPGIEAFYKEEIHTLTISKAFLKLKQYQPTYPFGVWLKSIAKNNVRDFLRRRKLQVRSLENLEIVSNDSPDRLLEAKETSRLIEEFIDLQDVRCKKILKLRFQGMKCAEISKCLGLPLGTITTILFRSRIKLRELIT